jgi:hypothetical protein
MDGMPRVVRQQKCMDYIASVADWRLNLNYPSRENIIAVLVSDRKRSRIFLCSEAGAAHTISNALIPDGSAPTKG